MTDPRLSEATVAELLDAAMRKLEGITDPGAWAVVLDVAGYHVRRAKVSRPEERTTYGRGRLDARRPAA